MPADLSGACQCGAVRFRLSSHTPHPYQLCYCSICRQSAGGGGFAINLMAVAGSLDLRGAAQVRRWHARMPDGSQSSAERSFCARCGSALWLFSPEWPELIHPHVSAITSTLPTPPSRTHVMLASRASWVEPHVGGRDERFDAYPERSIAAWHREHGLWVD